MNLERWYTISEIAELFRVTGGTVGGWRRAGKFPNARKPFGNWIVPESDLREFARIKYAKRVAPSKSIKRRQGEIN